MSYGLWNPFILFFLIYAHTLFKLNPAQDTQPNDIPIYDWKDFISIKHSNIASVDKSIPFLVRNGPSKHWPLADNHQLLKHLAFIFSDYGNTSFNVQTSNCSCFNSNYTQCTNYINVHTYFSQSKQQKVGSRKASFWYPYEVNYQSHKKYDACVHKTKQFDHALNIIHRMPVYNALMHTNHNASSIQFSFKVMDQDTETEQLYVDDLTMKCLHLMPLNAHFGAFDLSRNLHDLQSIHLWFGSNNYRTSLHFDFDDNLFFMLHGYKTFLLSPPSLDRFNLFPFLHESERQTSQQQPLNMSLSHMYQVTVEAGDVLWLPSFWYHEVINGDLEDMMSLSYGVNLWILDKEMKHYLEDKIEHYQFPKYIQNIFEKPMKNDNWNEILYFVNRLESMFDEKISDHNQNVHGLMMRYLTKIYPILSDIQHHHLCIGNRPYISDNLLWLQWFIDVSHKQQEFEIFHKRSNTLICKQIHKHNKFESTIDEIIASLLKVKEVKDEQVAAIALAILMENMWSVIFNDTELIPLVASLHIL